MQRFGKVYMKPTKHAQTRPGPSSLGELGAAPTETPAMTEAAMMIVEGTTVVGTAMVAETAEVAPVDATVEAGTVTGEAVETTVEADSGSSSSFSYEDSEESKEMVLETRPEVGLDEVGPAEEPEARPVDPLIAQFGEDDGWWQNMVDFVRREAEDDVRDPPDYWPEQIPQDEVQASRPRRDASRSEYATAMLASRGQVDVLFIFPSL